MRGFRTHRPSSVAMRPLVVILLVVCFGLAGSAARPLRQSSQTSAPADFPRAAAAAIAHGKRADAEAMARARGAADPAAAAILARLAIEQGKYGDAQAMLEPQAAQAPNSDAALELALLYRTIGRDSDAQPLLNALLKSANAGDGASLFRAARAAHALGRARDANTLYREAERAGADPAAVETSWGQLFLEKYNRPEAQKSFQAALKSDSAWAPAHAGLARVLQDDDPPAAAESAKRAIEIDPQLADPHLLLAALHLDEDRRDEAHAELDKVLATNPSNLEAHAMLAGMAYVHDDRATFDREVAAALAINPVYGEVYRIAAEQAASHYRFEEAAALAERALALDPSDARASGDLGMHLMRTGDETGARRALDRAFKADPYDVVTYNLLSLLDTLDQFVTVRDGDFIFRMHRDEEPVLREYAIPLAKDAVRTLSARYGFTPTGPLLIEIFPNHDDFAVRNLGLPGMIGALGACFGKVVTMDSPRARQRPGTFAWQATLWHELAHVITLQLSKQRIPRWLTEGISVYEEGRQRPEWGRDMDVTFAQAMNKDKVLKLKDLNAGFTRPDTISLAYYEASLLVDHIVKTFGEPALRALVASYAQGIDTDAAVKSTLKVSMDDLQATFDRALEQQFGAMRAALKDADKPVDGRDVNALKAAAAAQPGSFIAQLALGEALAAAGDAAAYAPLERAAALVPVATGSESPHALMAALAEKLNDRGRALAEYEALIKVDHTNIEAARKLAELAQAANDEPRLTLALERIVSLDPFDSAAHTSWGRLALQKKDVDIATREFRAALLSGAADKAAAHCDLGESYLLANRPADAKKEALAALEIAPSFERAQELLLNAIERKS
jgi:Tfp pilus assembly protein PilF